MPVSFRGLSSHGQGTGIAPTKEKTEGPSSSLPFWGIELDTQAQACHLPANIAEVRGEAEHAHKQEKGYAQGVARNSGAP